MFDPRNNLAGDVSEQLILHFGDKVYATIVPRNVRLEGVDPPNPVPPWPRDDELPPPTLRIAITKTLAGIDVRQ